MLPSSSKNFQESIEIRIVIFALILAPLMTAFNFLINERHNFSFNGFKKGLKQGFKNLLGIRNKRKIAQNSSIAHTHKTNASTLSYLTGTPELSDSEESLSSDTDELSDSEEKQAAPVSENKSPKKTPARKNWGRGSSIYKSNSFQLTPPKAETSNIKTPIKTTGVYVLHNMHGKFFGRLTVNPKLIESLDGEQKRILDTICDTGRVIEGDSQGRKAWINLSKNNTNWSLKGKDPKYDFRFYATNKSNKERDDYYCTGFRASHKKQSRIIRFQ